MTYLGVQDKVRVALQEYGQREIYATLEELSTKTGLRKESVYQALYRLKAQGELEILKEGGNGHGHEKLIGVQLVKMPKATNLIGKVAQQSVEKDKVDSVETVMQSYPNLITYMKKRLAVENAKEQLISAGLDPEAVVKFDPDPMGEEAMTLLQKLIDKTKEAVDLKYERDAAKRNVEFYEAQKKEETRKMLAEGTNG